MYLRTGSPRRGAFRFFRSPPPRTPPSRRFPVASRPGSLSRRDRKSTRLNSSHLVISYAVFCLKKKINLFNGAITSNAIPSEEGHKSEKGISQDGHITIDPKGRSDSMFINGFFF